MTLHNVATIEKDLYRISTLHCMVELGTHAATTPQKMAAVQEAMLTRMRHAQSGHEGLRILPPSEVTCASLDCLSLGMTSNLDAIAAGISVDGARPLFSALYEQTETALRATENDLLGASHQITSCAFAPNV